MRKVLSFLTFFVFSFSACKKDNTVAGPAPVADFSLATAYLSNDTSQLITMAAYDGFSLNNNSANADTYFWDFGNGTTSTDKAPVASYSKSGSYTLKLTASAKDGRKSEVTKTVKVLDYISKQIVITSLNSQSALGWGPRYPAGNKLNVWAEILQGASNQRYPLSSSGVPEAPLVYKTAVATGVDASKIPLSFDIFNKLAIDMQTFGKCCGYSGLGYIVNVYGQDNTGTYLLFSSYGSGIGFSMSGDIRYNRFEITTGFNGTNLSLTGNYE
jgi:PKD repeat protein